MKKSIISSIMGLLLSLVSTTTVVAYELKNEKGLVVGSVDSQNVFYLENSFRGNPTVNTDPVNLLEVARETLDYLQKYPEDQAVVHSGLLKTYGVTVDDIKKTLSFIIDTIREDQEKHQAFRILDSSFLQANFKFYRWRADRQQAARNRVFLKDDRIRLTKYVVYETRGSEIRTPRYTFPLYALPDDEVNLSPEQAEIKKSQLIRYRFTKQQIVRGALSGNPQVHPLVWLTRQGLEDALMQGTIQVNIPGKTPKVFNVHRNNGILYDRRIKNPYLQNRYWYFKQVNGIQGYGRGGQNKITVQPGVTFAGDVYNLGLGKLVAINYPMFGKSVTKLGIIADTGGAFVPNLYQLDFLAGVFPSRAAYQQGVKHLPTVTRSWILIKKE